jgi:hypothetical protein
MCLPEPVREDAVACLKPGGIAAGVQAEHNYARRADEPKQVAFVRFGEAVKRHSAQATTLVGPETNERVSEASDRHRQATTTHGHPRTRPPSRALKSWLPTASRMVGSSGLSIGSMTSLVDTVGLLFASASTADLRSLSRNVRSQPGGLLPLDGAGGLAGDVEHDPIHFAHLIRDPRRDARENLVRHARPISGHCVFR